MQSSTLRIVFALFIAATGLSVSGRAEDTPPERALTGEITLEDTTKAKRNPYQVGQDAAIESFANAETVIAALARGEKASLGTLPDSAINHLLGVYLYCTVRAGACPFILDAILELDIIAAGISGQAACPTMERFWKAWIRDDMEKRLKYLVRTANLDITSQFARVERPRYLKCRETVAAELGEGGATSPFFTRRYADINGPRAKVSKLARLLVELKAKVPDTIAAAEAER